VTVTTLLLSVVCHHKLGLDTVYTCAQNLMILSSAVLEISLGVSQFKLGNVILTMPLLSVICHAVTWHSLAIYACKFEHYSFSRSGDIVIGAHQNLNGSRDLTTPLSGVVCQPWASTCYDRPIYQIWSLYPLRKCERRY